MIRKKTERTLEENRARFDRMMSILGKITGKMRQADTQHFDRYCKWFDVLKPEVDRLQAKLKE